MKHTLGLIKISAKSLLRKNNGNKLLLIAICILTLVPMFLYNTTNSIIATVKDQRTAVYGIFDEIYYREQVSELSAFTDETFEGLLPNYRYESYGVFYTAKTLPLEGNKSLNLGFADSEAIRIGCISIKEGRLPETDNEIALTEGVAQELGNYSVGQEITIENQTYSLCGIVNDFGRLWPRGELQIKDNITPVNAFITQNRLEQVFEETHSITQQIVIIKEAEIVNSNDDTTRLFSSNKSFDVSENFSIPQSFMVLMYVISLLIVTTILIMNKTKLLARIRNYLLLGMNKGSIFFILMFEMICILIIGAAVGSVLSFFASKACLHLLLNNEYSSPVFDFNMQLNTSLILSLCVGFIIAFTIYAAYIVKQIALDSEISGKHYKNTKARISIFKLDMFKNRKAIIAIVLLISLSCTLLSYGIAYKNYFTEDVTETNSNYVENDYDFQFASKLINAPPLTDKVTGEQITPLLFTNNYEKNGADQDFIDSVASIPGVSKILSYRENQKMNLLVKADSIDTYFDGSDSMPDGRYSMETFMQINNYNLIWDTFQYADDDVLICSEIVGYSQQSLEELKASVIEGEINIDKIMSGEEVILRVPAYKITEQDFGGTILRGIIPAEYDDPDAINMTQFKVGDEITLSGLLTDEPLNGGVAESDISLFYRKDVTVKIGAIIRSTDGKLISSRAGAACSVLTANEALDELGIPATYSVVSIYTDIDANNTLIAKELQVLGLDYPNMTFENWSSDVRTYKIYNLLVAIFAVTFMVILTVVTFTMLLIQLVIKTRLSLSTYTLYRINGLSFRKLIASLLLQLVAAFSIGAILSVPMTWLIIKKSFNILGAITHYFTQSDYLFVVISVFVLMIVSFIPSLVILYKRKNNILLD